MRKESISVFSDVHGHLRTIEPAVDAELARGNRIVFAGDFVDGPDTAGVIRLIRSLGERASAITGNHEWVLRNSLADAHQLRSIWRDRVWPSYERTVFESYHTERTGHRREDSERLAEAMRGNGDLAWLNNLPAYYETNDTIVVHAGPNPDEPWTRQRQALDAYSQYPIRMSQEPDQVFSIANAHMASVPRSVDERMFVTGHAHLSLPITERANERRVRIGTWLTRAAPLLVWRSDERRILSYQNRDY